MCKKGRTWKCTVMGLAAGGLLLAMLAGPALADEKEEAQKMTMEKSKHFTPELMKVNWLIGQKVVNEKAEELGRIEDVVLTPGIDRISYAVLASGGVWGIGGKLVAVPWQAFDVQPDAKKVVLPVDKKTIEDASGFDKNKWPETGDQAWLQRVQSYFKAKGEQIKSEAADQWDRSKLGEIAERAMQPAEAREQPRTPEMAAGQPHFKYRRVTELTGLAVKNRQAQDLGEIEDLVVDRRESRLTYAYIGFGGLLGLGEKMAAVPWSAIEVRPRLDIARLDADKSLLEAIAFEQGQEPNLSDTQTASRLHERFAQEPYWEVFGYVEVEEPAARRTMEPWQAGSQYNAQFDPNTVVQMEATVESVGTFMPASNTTPGLRLKVRTPDGKTMTVHAGPRAYAAQKGANFYYGDRLTIKASRTQVDGKTVLIATEIKKGDQTLQLRDASGQPKWNPNELR